MHIHTYTNMSKHLFVMPSVSVYSSSNKCVRDACQSKVAKKPPASIHFRICIVSLLAKDNSYYCKPGSNFGISDKHDHPWSLWRPECSVFNIINKYI